MSLTCPYCNSPIPAENIQLNPLVAKCKSCRAIFGNLPPAEAPPVTPTYSSEADGERLTIPLPKSFSVTHKAGELVIEYPWLQGDVIPSAIFAVIWNVIMLIWVLDTIRNERWGLLALVSFFVVMSPVLLYVTVAGVINMSTLRVAAGELIRQHGPLPVGRPLRLAASTIRQLFSREEVRHNKQMLAYRVYSVLVITTTDQYLTLVENLPAPEQALYIEQQIERALRIPDKAVPNEFRR